MKKKLLSLLFLIFGISTFGQTMDESVVREFGNNIQNMCSTQDFIYFDRAQKLCTEACRVKDKIMEDFIRNSGVKGDLVQTYLQGFHNARKKGVLNINFRNVRTIKKSEQAYSSHYGASTSRTGEQYVKNFTTVACEIITNGALTYHIQDLYYVLKGHIVKITPYEEIIDQRTGEKKVKVDFSDLVDLVEIDVDRHGFRYGYSKLTPWNFSLVENLEKNGNFGYTLQIGLLGGLLEPAYRVNDGERTNIYRVHGYIVVGPNISIPYLTLNCGLGFMLFRKTIVEQNNYNDVTIKNTQGRFMAKPTLALDIPITDEVYIGPYAGYNFVLGQKDLNTWEFGLGIQWEW